jgi:hypothetical protein
MDLGPGYRREAAGGVEGGSVALKANVDSLTIADALVLLMAVK